MNHILLVDDDKDFLETLAKDIRGFDGFQVHPATSGTEALKLIGRVPIEIAIIDIRMPGMDGIELLTRIRSENSSVDVIMLTGYGPKASKPENLEKCYQLGVFSFIEKPYHPRALRNLLRKCLSHRMNKPGPTADISEDLERVTLRGKSIVRRLRNNELEDQRTEIMAQARSCAELVLNLEKVSYLSDIEMITLKKIGALGVKLVLKNPGKDVREELKAVYPDEFRFEPEGAADEDKE